MLLEKNKITYCTNIHKGESWTAHFTELKKHVPRIRQQFSPDEYFGLGLRLSAQAARELQDETTFDIFKKWLKENRVYIATMNGFPYGEFHNTAVKDKVHFPDWTSEDRVAYTQALFQILTKLSSQNTEAGISTSPLSYRHWYEGNEYEKMVEAATSNIIQIADYLYLLDKKEDKTFHLDIEPEPDGVLETAEEFIEWYVNILLPKGIKFFHEKHGLKAEAVESILKKHIRICYDICHIAVGFENQSHTLKKLRKYGIQVGKVQVSAALKIQLKKHSADKRKKIKSTLEKFNEPVYLHQVIAMLESGELKRYKDLPDALPDIEREEHQEWRSHFHIPIFTEKAGDLESTQSEILDLLELHKNQAVSTLFEVETYTWEVLPKDMQQPIEDSIVREMQWLKSKLS